MHKFKATQDNLKIFIKVSIANFLGKSKTVESETTLFYAQNWSESGTIFRVLVAVSLVQKSMAPNQDTPTGAMAPERCIPKKASVSDKRTSPCPVGRLP